MSAYSAYAAHNAYRRNEPSTGWTRIDLLLALYDGAVSRLDRAEEALRKGDVVSALPLISRTQLIVSEMAAGVRVDVDEEMGTNILRLYDYVVHELREPKLENIRNARKILLVLKEGFESIRVEANELERSGQLQAAENLCLVHTSA